MVATSLVHIYNLHKFHGYYLYIRRIRLLVKKKLYFPNLFSIIPTFSIFLITHVQKFPNLHNIFPRIISGNTTDEILTFHKLYIHSVRVRCIRPATSPLRLEFVYLNWNATSNRKFEAKLEGQSQSFARYKHARFCPPGWPDTRVWGS